MKCPVCGNNTFDDNNFLDEICKECFWQYDYVQVKDPDYIGGANGHSLNEYKKIYHGLKVDDPNFSCTNIKDRDLIIKMDNNYKRWYEKVHNLTSRNRKVLNEFKKCACIYCNKKFDVSEIDMYLKDDTALCPYCTVDSVIPLVIDGNEISDEELNKLNKYFF